MLFCPEQAASDNVVLELPSVLLMEQPSKIKRFTIYRMILLYIYKRFIRGYIYKRDKREKERKYLELSVKKFKIILLFL